MYLPPDFKVIKSDVEEIFKAKLPWKSLAQKNILITGASGMLAAYLVDVLMLLPEYFNCSSPKVEVLIKNREKAEKRFAPYLDKPNFSIKTDDICGNFDFEKFKHNQIIIHAASISRPDSKRPVEVMAPNIIGTWRLLEMAREIKGFEQFIFFSSGIVNGENIKSDVPITEEMYFGSSCTGPGACYSEAKRAGETICLSFMKQSNVPVKIIRYFGSYGPGMDLHNDPRAFTSFVKNAVTGEDITLFSTGEDTRFWCYITDATDGFFRVFFDSRLGEVWNIANEDAGCMIREFAEMVCEVSPADISLKFDSSKVPAGYIPYKSQQITVPSSAKLRGIGYSPKISIKEGLQRTISAYTN